MLPGTLRSAIMGFNMANRKNIRWTDIGTFPLPIRGSEGMVDGMVHPRLPNWHLVTRNGHWYWKRDRSPTTALEPAQGNLAPG